MATSIETKAYGSQPFTCPEVGSTEYKELYNIYDREGVIEDEELTISQQFDCGESCGNRSGCGCVMPVSFFTGESNAKLWHVSTKGEYASVVYCEACGDKKGFKVDYKTANPSEDDGYHYEGDVGYGFHEITG